MACRATVRLSPGLQPQRDDAHGSAAVALQLHQDCSCSLPQLQGIVDNGTILGDWSLPQSCAECCIDGSDVPWSCFLADAPDGADE